jgi:hypothetical protein
MRRPRPVVTTAAGATATVASGRATFRASRIGDRSDVSDVVAIAEGMIILSYRASTIRHDPDGVCPVVNIFGRTGNVQTSADLAQLRRRSGRYRRVRPLRVPVVARAAVSPHFSDVGQDGVSEADETGQHEIGLVVARVAGTRLQPAVGNRQDAQTVRVHAFVDRHAQVSCRRVERQNLTAGFEAVARIGSGAPFVMRSRRPAESGASTTTDRRRRSKSKSIFR